MMRQWPIGKSGPDMARSPYGIDTVNDIATMGPGRAQQLDNMEYDHGTLRRRAPFIPYSTEQFQDIMSGAIEYIDPTDTERILVGFEDGKVKEITSTSASTDRITGLTTDKRSAFAQMLGAVFHQNYADTPRRGDTTTWRVAGAPARITNLAGTPAAGALTGPYIWIITACIHDGTNVILESDHSNYVSATLATQKQALTWSASADSRVNWYRIYRVKKNQGGPFYLLTEGALGTYSYEDNTADTGLSATVAAPITRNGTMPKSALICQAGQRMVLAQLLDSSDTNAAKAVHVSIIATNRFEMEYYPTDGIHKFYLPGAGKVTAVFAFSAKDEDNAAKDVFLAQRRSCYILRGADPYGTLEPVSHTLGVVGDRAITQSDRGIFFISMRGLEYYGGAAPVLISEHVRTLFFGGGPMDVDAYTGDEYLCMEIHRNNLLITMRDDSSKTWGNKVLVMDLGRFDPAEPVKTAYFTIWNSGGGMGFSHFIPRKDGSLLLFDNQNAYIQKAGTGMYDYIAATALGIPVFISTGGLMSADQNNFKVLHHVNIMQQAMLPGTMDIFADYGQKKSLALVVPSTAVEVDWDKAWDKDWFRGNTGSTTVPVSRDIRGRIFQAKITPPVAVSEYTYIGLSLLYTAVRNLRMVTR